MVPPVTEDEAMPLDRPLQLTLAVTDVVAVNVEGWMMFKDEVEEQPLASLTVSV